MIRNNNIISGDNSVLVPAKLNFGETLLDKLLQFKDNVCFINGASNEKLTYGEILQQSLNVAVSLTHLGAGKGQTIGVFSENRNEYFPAAIGAICSGATLTTFNVGYTAGELKHVFDISKPSIVFCSLLAYKTHQTTLKGFPFLKKIILFGSEIIANTVSYNSIALPKHFNNSNELFNVKNNELLRNVKYEEVLVPEVEGQNDTVVILYSSGTTGLPKGVALTHLNMLTACCQPPSHDVTQLALTITPWYHSMGLNGNFTALFTGRTAVYLPKFDIQQYLKTIENYKVVQLTVVPPVLVALCKVEFRYDVTSVRMIYSGAAPLRADTVDALKIKFPNATVFQGYGMTETTLAVCRDLYNRSHLAKIGGVGLITPGITIKIADLETNEALGPNKPGELCIKGPLVMKGYVGIGRQTWLDKEGYFRTGDIGYYDKDGCFFIVDRLKELIKYKGFQVPPAEIEAVLLTHPALQDAGVVAKPHTDAGEVPLAFVVKRPGVEVTEDQVKSFIAEKLSNPKHLRGGVRFVEQIPKSPSGKILRKELKKMVRAINSKL